MFFSILFFSLFGNLFSVHLTRMDFLFEKNLNFFKTDSKNNLYYIYKTYDDVNTENQNGEKIMNNQYHKRVLPTNNYNDGQQKVTASFLSAPM